MPFLYIVRCRFTRSDLEASWNDWYDGEKTAQLLAKPMFRAVQRFRRSAGHGRDYLALWQVSSPAAFGTPEYKADWGFAQWHPYITDWSRDLFDAAGADERALAVPLDGALGVIAFDGLTDGAAAAARDALQDQEMLWCPSVGLDRHTPAIGLRRFDEGAAAQAAMARRPAAAVQVGVYRPLGAFARAQATA
jgi:hypothetical protein